MPFEIGPFLLVLFGLIAVVGFVVARRFAQARIQGLSRQAMMLGLTFSQEGSAAGLEGMGLHLFEQGHSQRVINAMNGRYRSYDLSAFDYYYTTGSGKNRTTHSQTVVLYRQFKEGFPRFELRPEHVFHKIGQIFGYQDIDFPQREDFSKRYLLRGEDERAVREAFRTYILDHFQNRPGWSLECNGDALLIYRHGKKVKPDGYQRFLDEVAEIRELFR